MFRMRSFCCVFALLAAGMAIPAQNSTGGWASMHGGPDNNRRTMGQKALGDWQMVWRSPRVISHTFAACYSNKPLVSGNRVVFRNNLANTRQYAALRLADGSVMWQHIAGTTLWQLAGCITANRVFIPLSMGGGGPARPKHKQRIECVSLSNGAHAWTWNSGVDGMVSPLQAYSGFSGTARDRVIFSLAGQGGNKYNLRVAALDANWPGPNAPSLLAVSTPLSANIHQYHLASSSLGKVSGRIQILRQISDYISNSNWKSSYFEIFNGQNHSIIHRHSLSKKTYASSGWVTPSPVLVDGTLAYLYESGGLLRAYDLVGNKQLWSIAITTSPDDIIPIVRSRDVLILNERTLMAQRFDRGTGAALGSTPIPGAFHHMAGCLLDSDTYLLPLNNGNIHFIDSSGNVSAPVMNIPNLIDVVATNGMFLASTKTELIAFKPVQLTVPATVKVGASTKLMMESPADPGFSYLLGLSFGTNPGIVLPDTRIIPLSFDPLLEYVLLVGAPLVQGHVGQLDPSGRATATLDVPQIPGLAGLDVYAAYVVLDPGWSAGIRSISMAKRMKITL